MKKLAGVLPKNQSEPYREPERPKRAEIEEASDGTFTIKCYGGKGSGMAWDGKMKTAPSFEEAMSKAKAHFEGKEDKEVKGEKE